MLKYDTISWHLFHTAEKGSIYNRIYEEKIRPQELGLIPNHVFIHEDDGLDKITQSDRVALFYTLESALDNKKYRCQMDLAFRQNHPRLMSAALPKKSPYLRVSQKNMKIQKFDFHRLFCMSYDLISLCIAKLA